jgi:ADP-dependent NAD(P)H-hydrate dehydratase / NAD(P)H-hydrate epimerase
MQKVVTAEEMREIDRLTPEKYGIPSILLMENAAYAAARIILEKFNGSVKGKSVLVLCGKGNNGGDGAALARILALQGAFVDVILFGKVVDIKGDAKTNFDIFGHKFEDASIEQLGLYEANTDFGRLIQCETRKDWDKYLYNSSQDWDLIIDAVFGTGLNRHLEIWLYNVIHHINFLNETQRDFYNFERLMVSLDIPTGFNSDSYEGFPGFPEGFQADFTISFTAPKLANVFPPASNFNGELHVVNIGSPRDLIDNSPSKLFVTENSDVLEWLYISQPNPESYKKTRGTALIIAGSENYSGAAVLAANSCFASGCGMVTVAVPKEILTIVASKTSDEIIVKTTENIEFNVDVVALGCGLASEESSHKFIRETVVNRKTPMVLDAEALNALSPFDIQGSEEFPLILTPHIGELRRLLGRELGDDKIAEAREFAQKHNVILVLKGARSLIAKPDGTVVINPTGNSGVSRAGAGDTLAGIITSFLAQGFAVKEKFIEDCDSELEIAFNAVVAALYIAGMAGDVAAKKFSERLMTATDVRNCLQEAIEELQK